MVPEIKVGTDYFIGALGNYTSSGSSYRFFDGTSIKDQYTNYEFCVSLRVENCDRENFFIFAKPENCTTKNYCLCEYF